MRVLIVGSGGREHALAWAIARSPLLTELHAAPGNPGIAELATVHDVGVMDAEGLVELSERLGIDLAVVGPEAPLVAGLGDRLSAAGIASFAPSGEAAMIEGSKEFAKQVMIAAGVPTARHDACDTIAAAQAAIAASDGQVVVKADGLAAGKGVFVCSSALEAEAAVRACLTDRRFGGAGSRVLIEERLSGSEVSLLALCDGDHVRALAPARDYKRIGDGDRGPNTGGMGCVSPLEGLSAEATEALVDQIHRPVIAELRQRGITFQGCLYAGLMMTDDGPKVLEFNARFGDPETQVIVPRLDGDLLEALVATAEGRLAGVELHTSPRACLTVVMAAAGYPEAPEQGAAIGGLARAADHPGVVVFHAGTSGAPGAVKVAGGRVLNVTATGDDLDEARERAYAAADEITFDGMQMRRDIGLEAGLTAHRHA
jgi:phosphoribosylamine--glycine ligase